MRIRHIEVANFRALRNSAMTFSDTTALIGENNSGKSAFLAALGLFFANSPRVGGKDFSDGDTETSIDITVHFSDLTPYDRQEFESNLLDGQLVVTRRLLFGNPGESGRFFVSAKVNPEFSACRNEQGKTEKRKLYTALREKYELPKEKNADEIDGYLEAWEDSHPQALKLERVAGFKGWKNVAAGKLKEKTDFIFIRAVQDAAEDIQESKSSPVKNLIDTLARQTIENNVSFQTFMTEANKKIAEFTNPGSVPALAQISSELTKILGSYYKDSEIIATWQPVESIQPSFPTSEIELRNNEFVTNIEGVGHGLQRAVILTVLQYMAQRRAEGGSDGKVFDEAQSDIIIAVEEPEIYQHPVKQRLFAKVLNSLARGFNKQSGIRIQTIYVTHSPLLVSLHHCDQIRLVRYNANAEKNVVVHETTLDACAKRLADAYGIPADKVWAPEKMGAKLHTFRGEIAEGFFGKCAILVEGPGDKAFLEAWFQHLGRDPHAEGIVVADVGGKESLSNPIVVFEKLGIPCFWIFDNDSGKPSPGHARHNRALQQMAGMPTGKIVDYPVGVFAKFAAWNGNIEAYVKTVAADKYEPALDEASALFEIPPSACLKFPASAAVLLARLREAGCAFEELNSIVSAVDLLAGAAGT